MQMNSADSLDTEAAGTYVKTMYATMQNGKNHVNEYSTYGRFFTFGVNMVTQILAKIDTEPLDVNNDPTGADRFTLALEDATDELKSVEKETAYRQAESIGNTVRGFTNRAVNTITALGDTSKPLSSVTNMAIGGTLEL